MIDYRKEINKLYDALDTIAKFEESDSLRLKSAIRAEIARLDKIEDELGAMKEETMWCDRCEILTTAEHVSNPDTDHELEN